MVWAQKRQDFRYKTITQRFFKLKKVFEFEKEIHRHPQGEKLMSKLVKLSYQNNIKAA